MSYDTKNIRNVVLLGHSGSGKTTLAETMLFESGAITRIGSVDEGNTTSDYTNIEQERKSSIFGTLMNAKWRNNKINILDTPGLDDFTGEVVSALKVADTAAILINSKSGVEVGTELVWEQVEKNETPAFFVITQLDHEKADYERALEQANEIFGSKALPIQFPVNAGAGFNAIVDALRMTMYVFPEGGGKPEKKEIPEGELERAQDMHNELVEAAAESDEELMEKFFEDGSLTEAELADGLKVAIKNREFFPVFCCSATQNMGTGRIMGFINDICPSPADRDAAELEGGDELECDSSGDPVVFIYKTISEPRVGNVSYFKVYSGTLNAGDELVNPVTRNSERMGQLFTTNGKNRSSANQLKAGDLGAAVKLKDAKTGDTLTLKGKDIQVKGLNIPAPKIRMAVDPPSKQEMEKLMKALIQISAEDPTIQLEQSQALKQTILHGQGQLHLDITKYRIEKVNGISMNFIEPKIPYRETITKTANASYRHKKQSGGSGQFGEVHMRIEPYYEGMPNPAELTVRNTDIEELPWGGTLSFYWCIVGGSIDAKYSNAIKKGVLQKMEEGPLTGSYCQDIRVSVYDGKMHSVDSNDMAFMLASAQAFKNAFESASPKLMEPVYDLEILCSGDVMGDIMGDLQTRRAIIQGMEQEGRYQKILAKVPLAELHQYSSSLRALSQGRAKFKTEFSEFQPVPHDLQRDLVNAYKASLEEA